jgi:PAT family beta-lactamase induction signal transducer AmpG
MTVDAYRIEILEPQDYALGSSIGSLGYKLGMLVSGAGALFIADRVSWNVIYLIFSGFTVLALMTSFFLTEPTTQHRQEPIAQAFFAPFKDFFRRPNVSEIVAFLVFYKLDVLLALALMTPFLMSLQFTQSDIAVTFKFGGLIFNTLGTFIGTILIKRWGLFWCLWVFEVLQIASGSLFWVLAQLGHNQSFMIGSILLENLCSGMGNCAFGVFLMGLCSKSPYAASQFALATSIMAFTRSLVHWPAGYLVKHLGWEEFFLVAILTGVPSLYLLYRSKYWNATSSQTATP